MRSPFALRNIRLFICLRVFFNSRFYYPVFTIIFLDYGLSIEQFSVLNAVWAATIVISEVPSGALADVMGRKTLLVLTAVGMVLEMTIIAFVPLGNGKVVFFAFLLNRIFSGLAEAMASGADEALAYDTLKEHGLEKEWGRVLDIQLRIRSAGYILVMTIGGLVYDPDGLRRIGELLGVSIVLDQQTTMRFPVYLTLVSAFLALIAALLMHERPGPQSSLTVQAAIGRASRLIGRAARWTVTMPLVLVIILFGTCFDHIMRMLVTLNSQYYRIIGLPEASYGLIGSMIAVIGIFVPRGARYMAEHWSPVTNVIILGVVTLVALAGLPLMLPFFGIVFMVMIFMVMMSNSFFMSHYLNHITASEMRATVLSFKGLVFNLAYSGIGLMYGLFFTLSRGIADGNEDAVFQQSLLWFPVYFLVLLGGLLLLGRRLLGQGGGKDLCRLHHCTGKSSADGQGSALYRLVASPGRQGESNSSKQEEMQ